jgi:hypothetical protein
VKDDDELRHAAIFFSTFFLFSIHLLIHLLIELLHPVSAGASL